METLLNKPYLKQGGFSEPVIAMKKLFNSTQTKQLSNNSSTLKLKSSLLSKQFDRCTNNFSFEQLAQKNPQKLKKSLSKEVIKENNDENSEHFMIYSLKPEYSNRFALYNLDNHMSEFCTERNDRPKRAHSNLSIDNRPKKRQGSHKSLLINNSDIRNNKNNCKIIEDSLLNAENSYYKETITLKGNIKKLKKELDLEKEKNVIIENELKSIKTNLTNERTKYQRELLKFSEKIKNFKNIQTLYIGEKQNSEKIEKNLILKEGFLQDYQSKIDEIISILMSHNKEFLKEDDCSIIIDSNEKANTILDSFKKLFNNIVQILRPVLIRNNLIKDLQSIQTIKITEKTTNIKELAKRIQKISNGRNSLDINQYNPERINEKLQNMNTNNILNTHLEKFKILNEFENLDNKLENVNQKIEKEILRQANSLEKTKNPLKFKNIEENQNFEENVDQNLKFFKNNYNSFSCVSKINKENECEKIDINNTFQIENMDYESFKTNLDKQIAGNTVNDVNGINHNFEQISEIKKDNKEKGDTQMELEKVFKDPSPSKSILSDLEDFRSDEKMEIEKTNIQKIQKNEKRLNSDNKENKENVEISENKNNRENKANLVMMFKSHSHDGLEKQVLQEKSLNEESENKSTSKKSEIFALVKFDFSPKKENDLKLKKGDKIQILKKTQNGWWIGMHKNKIGYFPYNYIEIH